MAKPNLSFEFFPPNNESQRRRFWHTLGCLETLKPDWISMTWGALGADNQPSLDVLRELGAESKYPVAAHLTCIGCTKASMIRRLTALQNMGINHIVALRGDLPKDHQKPRRGDDGVNTLKHAEELVAIVKQASGMDISVAAYPEVHPESKNAEQDLQFLKAKLDAGASRALTQFFFKSDVFLQWRDRAQAIGIDKPLVPGILPIHDIDKLQVFARRCGTFVPASIVSRFDSCGDSMEAKREVSLELATKLCENLRKEGVNDFHIYTLNQSTLAYSLGKRLVGVPTKKAVAA